MPVGPKKSRSRTSPPRGETAAPNAGGSDGALHAEAEPATAIVDGLHEVGAEIAGYAESTFDQTMHLARSLIDAGSLADVLALQRQFAQANLETLLAGSARVSEIGLRAGAALLGSATPPHQPASDDESS
jgi:hypothetical protein